MRKTFTELKAMSQEDREAFWAEIHRQDVARREREADAPIYLQVYTNGSEPDSRLYTIDDPYSLLH